MVQVEKSAFRFRRRLDLVMFHKIELEHQFKMSKTSQFLFSKILINRPRNGKAHQIFDKKKI